MQYVDSLYKTLNQKEKFSFGEEVRDFDVNEMDGVLKFANHVFKSFNNGQTDWENDIISISAIDSITS